jgi:hypothetical protein
MYHDYKDSRRANEWLLGARIKRRNHRWGYLCASGNRLSIDSVIPDDTIDVIEPLLKQRLRRLMSVALVE